MKQGSIRVLCLVCSAVTLHIATRKKGVYFCANCATKVTVNN